MLLEMIFTFRNHEQEILRLEPVRRDEIETRAAFINQIEAATYMAGWPIGKMADTIKISCCLYKCSEHEFNNMPEWYTACGGKLWFDEPENRDN